MHSEYHKACLTRLLRDRDAAGMYALRLHLPLDDYISLHNSFEKGAITASKALMNDLAVEGQAILRDWQTAIQDDSSTIPDMLAELEEDEVEIVLGWCDAETEMEVRGYAGD